MVIVYIAQTLDGKIADASGSVDFLNPFMGHDYGYEKFYSTIDTVIVGRKTYEHGLQLGAPAEPDKRTIVFSTQALAHPGIEVVSGDPLPIVKELSCNVWLMGGAQLIAEFLRQDLVDRLMLYTMPVLLGEGTSLFQDDLPQSSWQLESCKSMAAGVVETTYRRDRR